MRTSLVFHWGRICLPMKRATKPTPQLEKPVHSNKDPGQPKKNKKPLSQGSKTQHWEKNIAISTTVFNSSPAPQFESISSSVLSLLYGPTLTSVHGYWKNLLIYRHCDHLCMKLSSDISNLLEELSSLSSVFFYFLMCEMSTIV